MYEKFQKVMKFITKDIWHLDVEEGFTGLKRVLVEELRIMILELKMFYRNKSFSKASSLAFTTLLSLIPVMAIFFMFIKMFGGSLLEEKVKPFIYEFLVSSQSDKLSGYLDSFLSSATVDTLGSIGFIILLGALYSIMSSIEVTFNDIWNVSKARSPIEQFKTYLSIIFTAPILLIVSIFLSTKIESVLKTGVFSIFQTFWIYLLPLIFIFLIFLSLNKVMPNCKVSTRQSASSAVIGTILFTISKNGFIYYTKMAVSYNVIYGSIAILPFLMLWIYFVWVIIIFTVHSTYTRQNIKNLYHLERNTDLSRKDKIKIALIITFNFLESFIKNDKPLTLIKLNEKLDIPLREIRNVIEKLEAAGIIAEKAGDIETFLPAKTLSKITFSSIISAVDKEYLPENHYKAEKDYDNLLKECLNFIEIPASGKLISFTIEELLDKKNDDALFT